MTEAQPIRHDALPPPTRRGLHREEAAAYVGVSPTKFDAMMGDGRIPKPKQIDGRRVWDVRAMDRAFDALLGDAELAQTDEDDDGGWGEVLK
jgi:predicted DNA-binding transcriptional regulator AlpA